MKFFTLIIAAVVMVMVEAHDPGAAWCLKDITRVFKTMDKNGDGLVSVHEAWKWFWHRRLKPKFHQVLKRCNGSKPCLKMLKKKLHQVKHLYKKQFKMVFKQLGGADGKASFSEFKGPAMNMCRSGNKSMKK